MRESTHSLSDDFFSVMVKVFLHPKHSNVVAVTGLSAADVSATGAGLSAADVSATGASATDVSTTGVASPEVSSRGLNSSLRQPSSLSLSSCTDGLVGGLVDGGVGGLVGGDVGGLVGDAICDTIGTTPP